MHLFAGLGVGVGWWLVAPTVTYTIIGGRAFALDETRSSSVFGGDASFALLAIVAGVLVCGVLVLRGHRSVGLPLVLAGLGTVASVAAWWVAVLLGPGRLADLVAAAEEGTQVLGGPEINAYAVLLLWPMAALATLLVVTAFREPERRSAPPVPASGE